MIISGFCFLGVYRGFMIGIIIKVGIKFWGI